jgi:bifunctional non-homologous end joining protein LigD
MTLFSWKWRLLGFPQFQDLMFRRGELFFVAFDALWIDGEDLRGMPLLERKRRLRRVIPSRRSFTATLSRSRRGRRLRSISARLREEC